MTSTLIYHIATTLDGKIAHDDGATQGLLEEGPHVTPFMKAVESYSAVLMGRSTYEVGLAAGLPHGQPAYSGRPNYVFSRTLPPSATPHAHFELVREDACTFVRALKARLTGSIWLCGGGKLASALMDAELIDEVVLKLNPVVFGQGRPVVLGLMETKHTTLLAHQVYENGVVLLHYRVTPTPQAPR